LATITAGRHAGHEQPRFRRHYARFHRRFAATLAQMLLSFLRRYRYFSLSSHYRQLSLFASVTAADFALHAATSQPVTPRDTPLSFELH
jgi:hypothetical protein